MNILQDCGLSFSVFGSILETFKITNLVTLYEPLHCDNIDVVTDNISNVTEMVSNTPYV